MGREKKKVSHPNCQLAKSTKIVKTEQYQWGEVPKVFVRHRPLKVVASFKVDGNQSLSQALALQKRKENLTGLMVRRLEPLLPQPRWSARRLCWSPDLLQGRPCQPPMLGHAMMTVAEATSGSPGTRGWERGEAESV